MSLQLAAVMAAQMVAVQALLTIDHDGQRRYPDTPSAFFELPRGQAEKMEEDGVLKILDVIDADQLDGAVLVGGENGGTSDAGPGSVMTMADVGDILRADELAKLLQAEQDKNQSLSLDLISTQDQLQALNAQLAELQQAHDRLKSAAETAATSAAGDVSTPAASQTGDAPGAGAGDATAAVTKVVASKTASKKA